MPFTIPSKHKVSRKELSIIPKPMPLGSRHQPVHHFDLIEEIQKQIDTRFFTRRINGVLEYDLKLELIEEQHGVMATSVGSGTELYSNLIFNVYKDRGNKLVEAMDGEAKWSMAVINSNAQKRALTFFAGAIIGICTNGWLIKNVKGEEVKKKHITTMSALDQIYKGLQAFCNSVEVIEATITTMRETKLDLVGIDTALCQFARSGTMGWQMVGNIDKEYRSKKHQGMHGEKTVWSLYNAGTQVIKESTMLTQKRVMHGMQDDLITIGAMPDLAKI